jgi:uncharacterized protein
MFAIIDGGCDWERLSEVFAPDIMYLRPGYPTIHGIEELRIFYSTTRKVASGQHRIYRILSEGGISCCWGLFTGTTKDGEKVALYFTDWYRFANGKISYRRTFFYRPAV